MATPQTHVMVERIHIKIVVLEDLIPMTLSLVLVKRGVYKKLEKLGAEIAALLRLGQEFYLPKHGTLPDILIR